MHTDIIKLKTKPFFTFLIYRHSFFFNILVFIKLKKIFYIFKLFEHFCE